MVSPYKKVIKSMEGFDATIHRADAPDLKGEIMKDRVEDDGFIVGVREGQESGSILLVYVIYDNVRGVGQVDHDYGRI